MKKILFTGIAMTLMAGVMWTAPLRNMPVTLLQPDGDTLCCFASGDEYFNYWHDAGGYVIVHDETTGFYVYAAASGDDIAPSVFIAGRDDPQRAGLLPRTLPSTEKIEALVTARRKAMALPLQQGKSLQNAVRNAAANPRRNRGTMNNIVIFVRFADDPEFTPEVRSALSDHCDGDGISMKTYYREVSYGLFETRSHFYPVVSGTTYYSYCDSRARAYYQKGGAQGYITDAQRLDREQTLLKNAMTAVQNQVPSDLNIDMNNDGYVDNIIFIIKGDVSGWSDLLWPHMWAFEPDYTTTINGKTTGIYNFQIENNLVDRGYSTLCHEMFHTLGAPDLYHYTEAYNKLNPVDTWDLMEYNTSPPQHMSAYMKYKYGNWIDDIPLITANDEYTLAPLNSPSANNVCYKIPSQVLPAGSATEYYVVEYRKKTTSGIESQIPGSGLLIYRINPAFKGNEDYNGKTVLDEVYLYRPNGTTTANGTPAQAFFSVAAGRTEFNNATNPACFLSDGRPDDIHIADVSAAADNIKFTLRGLPESLTIDNEVVEVGQMQTLSLSVIPAAASKNNVVWSVQHVTGMAQLQDDKLLGQASGFVNLHVELVSNPNVYDDKRIIIMENGSDKNPVASYWENRGADGLLTLEAPEGVSKVELFSNGGAKVNEQQCGGTTVVQYSFTGYPRGLYFLKVWNAPATKFSNLKILW